MTPVVRHETRALLRAHLSAASPYRHRTRHCPVCHHLLRMAMASGPSNADEEIFNGADEAGEDATPVGS
ncbi:DUF6274 family protein [Streptomyces sp. NPDC091279]|uniref:DUF6274 family protein n=1 Tax=unclassified Streptomyces TaxID=2593676 RepID=UPI003809581F